MPETSPHIFLQGLVVESLIGVYPQERHAPQPLSIDVAVEGSPTATSMHRGWGACRSCGPPPISDATTRPRRQLWGEVSGVEERMTPPARGAGVRAKAAGGPAT